MITHKRLFKKILISLCLIIKQQTTDVNPEDLDINTHNNTLSTFLIDSTRVAVPIITTAQRINRLRHDKVKHNYIPVLKDDNGLYVTDESKSVVFANQLKNTFDESKND